MLNNNKELATRIYCKLKALTRHDFDPDSYNNLEFCDIKLNQCDRGNNTLSGIPLETSGKGFMYDQSHHGLDSHTITLSQQPMRVLNSMWLELC